MKKLLILIVALTICDAYGENVYWVAKFSTSSANTCSSGDNITKPSDPQRTGYRFIGWEEGTTDDLWYMQPLSVTQDSTNKTITATFPYGTVVVQAGCFSSNITNQYCASYPSSACTNNASPYTSGTRRYLWCKLTSINITDTSFPLKSQIISASNAKWRPAVDASTESSCNSVGTNSCADFVKIFAFRKHLLKGD